MTTIGLIAEPIADSKTESAASDDSNLNHQKTKNPRKHTSQKERNRKNTITNIGIRGGGLSCRKISFN